MRLMDLMPRWIHPNVFTFLCPHCQGILLSCKNVPISMSDQCDLIDRVFGEDSSHLVIRCKDSCAWQFENAHNFDQISITPSLDASAAGHWHGYITNGEIVGGLT